MKVLTHTNTLRNYEAGRRPFPFLVGHLPPGFDYLNVWVCLRYGLGPKMRLRELVARLVCTVVE